MKSIIKFFMYSLLFVVLLAVSQNVGINDGLSVLVAFGGTIALYAYRKRSSSLGSNSQKHRADILERSSHKLVGKKSTLELAGSSINISGKKQINNIPLNEILYCGISKTGALSILRLDGSNEIFLYAKKHNNSAQELCAKINNEVAALPTAPKFLLDGVQDLLAVFENRVSITPKTNLSSIIIRGMKGSKSIPYSSITSVQFRRANPINGYLQFSLPGGNESAGGIIAAISDENTCFFVEKDNELASSIKDYVESKISGGREPSQHNTSSSLSDELMKLAELKDQGALSAEEFEGAKRKLVG